jgi:hypothetical protein
MLEASMKHTDFSDNIKWTLITEFEDNENIDILQFLKMNSICFSVNVVTLGYIEINIMSVTLCK